nr:hypothetical protein Iba_chr13cCG11900 [Ipomoea batatas]
MLLATGCVEEDVADRVDERIRVECVFDVEYVASLSVYAVGGFGSVKRNIWGIPVLRWCSQCSGAGCEQVWGAGGCWGGLLVLCGWSVKQRLWVVVAPDGFGASGCVDYSGAMVALQLAVDLCSGANGVENDGLRVD